MINNLIKYKHSANINFCHVKSSQDKLNSDLAWTKFRVFR